VKWNDNAHMCRSTEAMTLKPNPKEAVSFKRSRNERSPGNGEPGLQKVRVTLGQVVA